MCGAKHEERILSGLNVFLALEQGKNTEKTICSWIAWENDDASVLGMRVEICIMDSEELLEQVLEYLTSTAGTHLC